MDFEQVVAKRQSIRNFDTDKKVPRELLEKILTHATLAPSSKNRQPWFFVVVQDDIVLKNKVADIMIEKLNMLKKQNPNFGPNSIAHTAEIVKQAPVFVAVFDASDVNIPNSIIQSIGAAIENLCLSATNYGVGSLWNCDLDICFDEIKEHLGVTEPYKLVAGVSLGYAAKPIPAPPQKLPLETVCKFR